MNTHQQDCLYMCNKLTSCLLVKWEASAVRWGWMDGLLIVEVCSYFRAVWGRSNRSLSLIYPPAQPSVHRHLSESINAIWLPASQQLCDRKSMHIIWQILYAHVCMRVPYVCMHSSTHNMFLTSLKLFTRFFSLVFSPTALWTVSCRLYSLPFPLTRVVFMRRPRDRSSQWSLK